MRWLTYSCATLVLVIRLCAVSPLFADNADEEAIHAAAVAYVDAYNSKDAAGAASLFTAEARVETSSGEVAEGAEAILAAFEAEFAGNPEAQISLEMESLRFLTPEVAVEQGATEFYPDGEIMTSRSKYLVVHVKRDQVWKVVSARSLEAEVVSNYEYLRRLSWLVGEWVDEGDGTKVESKFYWDEERNFLLQDYVVRTGDEVVMQGSQRIGWDPQAKQLRSWIFDARGGFGEAEWSVVDDQWISQVRGVGSEGQNVSAKRTLIPNGDRVQVLMTDRLSDGTALPDVEFTMVRRPPEPDAEHSGMEESTGKAAPDPTPADQSTTTEVSPATSEPAPDTTINTTSDTPETNANGNPKP